jgi:signal transduction histidine kinase
MSERRGLSIARIVLMLVVTQSLLMFFIEGGLLYWQRFGEVERDLQDRGQVLATALSESAVYGVVTRDAAALDQAIHRIRDSGHAVSYLAVLDPQGLVLASTGIQDTSAGAVTVERPITIQSRSPITVDLDPTLPVAPATQAQLAPSTARLGTALVVMSREPLLQARSQGFVLAAAQALLAAVVCGVFGWWLSGQLRRPLSAIMHALGQIQKGNYDTQMPATWRGEIGALQRAVLTMARSLAASTTHLEATVADRTAELHRAMEAVAKASDERRSLIARSSQQLEAERKRIALEIHDQMNAALIVLRMNAQHILDQTSKLGEGAPTGQIATSAQAILDDITPLYARARDIVRQLRPEVLDALGLTSALKDLVHSFNTGAQSCTIGLDVVGRLPNLPEDQSITIFRVVQEAISNALKHSSASELWIRLEAQTDGNVVVTVTDNGLGFEMGANPLGVGLIGMRERVEAVGGTLLINSAVGHGTEIRVAVPVSLAGGVEVTSP